MNRLPRIRPARSLLAALWGGRPFLDALRLPRRLRRSQAHSLARFALFSACPGTRAL